MSKQQTAERLQGEIDIRSAECERHTIAVREDGHAGVALVAPNCVLYAWSPDPEHVPFFDLYLN